MVYRKVIDGIGGINDLAPSIRIYPNPAINTLIVETEGMKMEHVTLLNALGKEVYSSRQSQPGNRLQIPLYDLSSGLYFVTIKTHDGVVSRKVIVER
jgi:hypothetical protein